MKYAVAVFITFIGSSSLFAQKDTLNSILRQLDKYNEQAFSEKLFVHTDRSFYLAGETIWFKIYCVDGTLTRPLALSKVAYLEVIDKDKKAVLQSKILLEGGMGNGSLTLAPAFNSGNYLVRVYTQWMKNFDVSYFFEKQITVVNTFKNPGLKPRKDSVSYDIQFFPEGGNLVKGIQGKVAFRVADKSGKGIDFKGAVLNQKNDTIVRFRPLKFGIGSFLFTPLAGNNYKAVIVDVNKRKTTVQLPAIYDQGYVMQLDETDTTRIKITVNVTSDASASGLPYVYLVAHTRQQVKFAETGFLQQGKTTFNIDRKIAGDGISHFTVFNAEKKPVCERLYFKQPGKKLRITVLSGKNSYGNREKIDFGFTTLNNAGQPQAADLSMAVYLLDSLQTDDKQDIESYLWLTSDLKGTVESPAYYFSDNSPEVKTAIDNLMLTHGWRRFRWDEILNKDIPSFRYVPEYNGHIIRGRVIDSITNLPASGASAYLSSPGKYIKTYGSRSDASGNVKFEMKNFFGPREIIAQANSMSNRPYRVEIVSPFAENFSTTQVSGFDLDEKLEKLLLLRSIHMQALNIYFENTNTSLSASIADSTTFYGKPDERYYLDNYTRFKLMEDVMREYVPGVQVRQRKGKFHFMVHNSPRRDIFQEDPLVLLDGVPVFNTDDIIAFDPLKIKRLDVLTQKYLIGPYIFSGVVSYTTYKGDLSSFPLNPHWLVLDYEGLQSKTEFYAPRYDTQKQIESRLPDFRNLLYWVPSLKTGTDGKQKLDFYSSDKPGKYLVVVQGLTGNGYAGSATTTFEVKKKE